MGISYCKYVTLVKSSSSFGMTDNYFPFNSLSLDFILIPLFFGNSTSLICYSAYLFKVFFLSTASDGNRNPTEKQSTWTSLNEGFERGF